MQNSGVAIVGIGCRLPGAVCDPRSLWSLLCRGGNAISEVPPSRWSSARYYAEDSHAPGRMNVRHGGFIDAPGRFDYRFFGISRREALRMDPQHRWLLEVTWECLEDAGVVPGTLAGSATGVFVGIASNDYGSLQRLSRTEVDAYTNAGNAKSLAANRISHTFDLNGPSLAVDTACSSSLLAVHLACRSLHNRECSLALAGGVNALLAPDLSIGFSKAAMLSPDGCCRTFDAAANGYVRSEGAAVVLLKRLEDALRCGDPIYAVVLGTAVNQDGRTPGIASPSAEAQYGLLASIYGELGIAPSRVAYVEAHGTGTRAGDAAEGSALGRFLSPGRTRRSACPIGSVKTNLGHLEAASGIVGMIKAALVVRERLLPASLHFQRPNPDIDWPAFHLRVVTACEPLAGGTGPVIVGANSFGFGGTNVHAVLGSPPPTGSRRGRRTGRRAGDSPGPVLIPVSARSEAALAELSRRLAASAAVAGEGALADLAHTMAHQRAAQEWRAVFLADSVPEWQRQAADLAGGATEPAVVRGRVTGSGPRPPVFVFCGQGGAYAGMGSELLRESSVFRRVAEQCNRALLALAGVPILGSVDGTPCLLAAPENDLLSQYGLFTLQVGLAAVWRQWGVHPAAVVGHSVGEIAAACVAGILSIGQAARLIQARCRVQSLSVRPGRMAAIGASPDLVASVLAGLDGAVEIGADNAPEGVTITGDTAAVQAACKAFRDAGAAVRQLEVRRAFHSRHYEPFRETALQAFKGIRSEAARIPLVSTVTGESVTGLELNARYWWRHLRDAVAFRPAIEQMRADGHSHFIEIGPQTILARPIHECFAGGASKPLVVPSLRRGGEEMRSLRTSLAGLYAVGHSVDWRAVNPPGRWLPGLPSYPWQGEECWHESAQSLAERCEPPPHPLLNTPASGPEPAWETAVNTDLYPYLDDHRFRGGSVMPAAAFVEVMLGLGKHRFGPRGFLLDSARFHQLLPVPRHELQTLRITLDEASHLCRVSAGGRAEGWNLCASGSVRPTALVAETRLDPAQIKASFAGSPLVQAADFYAALRQVGFEYGETFRCVRSAWLDASRCLASLSLGEETPAREYVFHPCLLDGCLQAIGAAMRGRWAAGIGNGMAVVPVSVRSVRVYARIPKRVWCLATVAAGTGPGAEGDGVVFSESGQVVAAIRGFGCAAVALDSRSDPEADAVHYCRLEWVEQERADSVGAAPVPGTVLLAQRRGSKVGTRVGACLAQVGQSAQRLELGGREGRDAQWLAALRGAMREAAKGGSELHLVFCADASPAPGREADVAWLESFLQADLMALVYGLQALAQEKASGPLRLSLVTVGAQCLDDAPAHLAPWLAALWGVGRVVMTEHPDLRCTLIDLPSEDGEATVPGSLLAADLLHPSGEAEIAYRSGKRFVQRLQAVEIDRVPERQVTGAACKGLTFRLMASRTGGFDSLQPGVTGRGTPAPGQVEIRVAAAGLNFRDALKVLGAYPLADDLDRLLGDECSGTVAALGAGIEDLAVGDPVMALAPGCLGSHVITDRQLVFRKPDFLSHTQAAGVPVAFLTAYHSLIEVARLCPGERVLIHSATGGVGQAAVWIAQHRGCQVFATAGTKRKRDRLLRQGVQHVFDSHRLDFVDAVLAATAGAGVDVVLNSLAGDFQSMGLAVLGNFGRFVEIGKRDIYGGTRLDLAPFRRSLSFAAVDLAQVTRERPEHIQRMLKEIVAAWGGQFPAVETAELSVSAVGHALRDMTRGRHLGKQVVALPDQLESAAPALAAEYRFAANGTYVVVGGGGGLGARIVRWLAQRGAGCIVIVGRSGVTSPAALREVEECRGRGARVEVFQADVCDAGALAGVLAEIRAGMPPLKGVIHSAMVLENAFLTQADAPHFMKVMSAKILGAWNLHRATRDLDLDLFVLVSSISALLGPPGQGSYVAANACLDALAHYRRAMGLPALSINLGAVAEVGYLAQHDDISKYLADAGVRGMSPEQATQGLTELLRRDVPEMGYVRVDWSRLVEPQVFRNSPKYSLLPVERAGEHHVQAGGALSRRIADLSDAAALATLTSHLRERIAAIVGVPPAALPLDQPFSEMGLDSLMVLEFKLRLDGELGFSFPSSLLSRDLTVSGIAGHLLLAVRQQTAPSAAERN